MVSAMGRYGAPYATDTLLAVAREVCTEINPREQDLLLSCGELISTVIMVQALKLHHVEARAFTGGTAGIITDSNFGDAHIIEVNPERSSLVCSRNKWRWWQAFKEKHKKAK